VSSGPARLLRSRLRRGAHCAGERRQEEKSKDKDKADEVEGKAGKEEKREDGKDEAAKAKAEAPPPPPAAAAEAPAAALSAEEIEDGRRWSAKVVLFAGMHPRCAPGPPALRAARPSVIGAPNVNADAAPAGPAPLVGRGGCADAGAPAAPGACARRPAAGAAQRVRRRARQHERAPATAKLITELS